MQNYHYFLGNLFVFVLLLNVEVEVEVKVNLNGELLCNYFRWLTRYNIVYSAV